MAGEEERGEAERHEKRTMSRVSNRKVCTQACDTRDGDDDVIEMGRFDEWAGRDGSVLTASLIWLVCVLLDTCRSSACRICPTCGDGCVKLQPAGQSLAKGTIAVLPMTGRVVLYCAGGRRWMRSDVWVHCVTLVHNGRGRGHDTGGHRASTLRSEPLGHVWRASELGVESVTTHNVKHSLSLTATGPPSSCTYACSITPSRQPAVE